MPRRDRRRTALLIALFAGPLLAVGLVAALRQSNAPPPVVTTAQERLAADGCEVMFSAWGRGAVPGKAEGLAVLTPTDESGDRYSVWAHREPGEVCITVRGRVSTTSEVAPPKFEAVYPADGGVALVADGCDVVALKGVRAACDRVAAVILDRKTRA